MRAILHNIRSIYNVASMFRTADGLGVEKLYLSGYTPGPKDRFGREQEKFQKVALGAENSVDFEPIENISEKIAELKSCGVRVLACEPTPEARDYREFETAEQEACLILGNEPEGLPAEILSLADAVIEIPMRGEKSSLNVSVAFGVIAGRLLTK